MRLGFYPIYWVRYETSKYCIALAKQYPPIIQLNPVVIFDLVFLFGFFLLDEERIVTYGGALEKVRKDKHKKSKII